MTATAKIVRVFHIEPREDQSGVDRVHVANITTYHTNREMQLEDAYVRTQNINGSWSRGQLFENGSENLDYNECIERVAPLHEYKGKIYGLRSSMMNDEFEIDGELYRCAMIGFEKVA